MAPFVAELATQKVVLARMEMAMGAFGKDIGCLATRLAHAGHAGVAPGFFFGFCSCCGFGCALAGCDAGFCGAFCSAVFLCCRFYCGFGCDFSS